MTTEHDLARKRGVPTTPNHDDDLAPGRRNLSSQMHAPANPLVGGLLQRKARDANGVTAGAENAVAAASASSSMALPADVRKRFEHSTGADLSGVRIHTGNDSVEAAHAVGAHAYTVGQDIHFAAGKYAPSNPAGLHLLAHEVAHTIQQGATQLATQYKLEVSTPYDAAEVEADHAADAMVRGGPVSIGGGSGLGQTLHRDTAATPAADTANKPAADATASGTTDDKSTLTWLLNWANKETGETVSGKSNARTGKDAATGTLKVIPEGEKISTFDWVNAASNGAVVVATTQQPKGKGGEVSSDISWGAPPSASASVTVQETQDDPKKVGKSQLPTKQKAAAAAASAVLHRELQASGQLDQIQLHMLDAARMAVGSGGEGYKYDVSVAIKPMKLDGGDGHSKAVDSRYSAPTGAEEQRHVTITVQTNRQTLKGSHTVENQAMNAQAVTHEELHQDAASAASSSTTDTEFETKTCTSAESIVAQAFDAFAQKLTVKNLAAEGEIKGSIAADQSGKVGLSDLTVDFGIIALALAEELGPVALLLSKALGTGKIGAEFSAQFKGSLSGLLKGKASWTDEDLKQTMTSFKSQVTTRFSKEIRTKVHTIVTQTATQSHNTGTLDKNSQSSGGVKKSSDSTETIGVKFDIGEPTLTVK